MNRSKRRSSFLFARREPRWQRREWKQRQFEPRQGRLEPKEKSLEPKKKQLEPKWGRSNRGIHRANRSQRARTEAKALEQKKTVFWRDGRRSSGSDSAYRSPARGAMPGDVCGVDATSSRSSTSDDDNVCRDPEAERRLKDADAQRRMDEYAANGASHGANACDSSRATCAPPPAPSRRRARAPRDTSRRSSPRCAWSAARTFRATSRTSCGATCDAESWRTEFCASRARRAARQFSPSTRASAAERARRARPDECAGQPRTWWIASCPTPA